MIEDPLAEQVLMSSFKEGDIISAEVKDGDIVFVKSKKPQAPPPDGHAADPAAQLSGHLGAFADQYPTLARLSTEVAQTDMDHYFAFSIEVILDGLERRLHGRAESVNREVDR